MKLKMKSFDQKSQLIQQYSLEVYFFCVSCMIQLKSDLIKKLDLMSYSAWIGHEVMMLLQKDWWMSGWMVTFSNWWSKWLFISDVCSMCGSNKHEMCRESFFLSWYISSGSQNAAPKQEEISRRSQAVLRMTTTYWRCLCRFVVNSPVGVWEAVNTLQLSNWVMQVKGDLSSTHPLKKRES